MNDDSPTLPQQSDALRKFATSRYVDRRFGGADRAKVDAFEARHGLRFSAAYRRFLERENGLSYHIHYKAAAERMPDENGLAFALSDINTLFGIGNGVAYLDLESLANTMLFHDYRLTPYAHVVALGGDFCTLVEIGQGRYTGEIMYTDGELFHGLSDVVDSELPVDESVEYLLELGYYSRIAAGFDELLEHYARLC